MPATQPRNEYVHARHIFADIPSRQSWIFARIFTYYSTPLCGLSSLVPEVPHAAMVVLRGLNTLLVARYTVFALFTTCNAIICSVAVWSYSLALYPQPSQVDVYLIFLGAFSLLSIFALVFVELLCINAVTTRVWFECVWVAFFWLMELAGGAALIAIGSDITCSGPTTTILNTQCTSERVLLGFTWMCAITLLVYLLVLIFVAASRYGDDPKIWVCDVRSLHAAATQQGSPMAPDSPPPFKKRLSVDIRRWLPSSHSQPSPISPYVASLSSEFRIEPFRPFTAPEQMDVSHLSNLPEATPLPPTTTISLPMKPVPPLPKQARNGHSLSHSQFDVTRQYVSSDAYPNSSQRSGPVSSQSSSSPTPSPLGDWPRQDVMQLPAKLKRKAPPVTVAPTDRVPMSADTATSSTLTQPRPRRPSGPRLRAPSGESGNRSPMQDLYGIRVYDNVRRDDTQTG